MLCAYSIGAPIKAGQISRENHYCSLCAPCSQITFSLFPAPFLILGHAHCPLASQGPFSLLPDYPQKSENPGPYNRLKDLTNIRLTYTSYYIIEDISQGYDSNQVGIITRCERSSRTIQMLLGSNEVHILSLSICITFSLVCMNEVF